MSVVKKSCHESATSFVIGKFCTKLIKKVVSGNKEAFFLKFLWKTGRLRLVISGDLINFARLRSPSLKKH